jgi:hypothetical protein
MDDIIKNSFDHPKFSANALNLVLIPKKSQWWRPLQFYFLLNHVLRKTGRTLGGELLAFSIYL